ncbi:MAG: glycerate kinase [Clostridium sp.]|nr:glycerate kinase [Clostridium sp.]
MKKIKFIVAPDSFKESLSAFQAASAIKEGISEAYEGHCIVETIPMADGGEGTSDVIINANNGTFVKVNIKGPLGEKIEGKYGFIEKDKKAVMEVASACGLYLLEEDKKNPLNTTSFGVGEMIIDALNKGAKHIIVGLGGSSTNDGGLGMLEALGAKAYDTDGNEVGPFGRDLINVKRIDLSKIDRRIKNVKIEVACDVENPLLGKTGATYIFGPQKGADEDTLLKLEGGMQNYVRAIKEASEIEISNIPKTGAAGGLGAAFLILGGKLVKGIDMVLKHTDFENKIEDANYIFTGEGSVDGQTKYGKTIAGIAKFAKKKSIPVIVLCGKSGKDVDELYKMGVTCIFTIIDRPESIETALKEGYENLRRTSLNVAKVLKERQ